MTRYVPFLMRNRRRLSFMIVVCSSLLAATRAFAASNALNISVDDIPAPAGPGAMGSSLVTSAEGEHWLSWLEPVGTGEHALKCARFDAARSRWGEPRLIARGAGWFVNWADFPVLAAQKNRLTAAWFVGSHGGGGHHCPVNGPQLASSGEHVAAAWFTAANNQPRVYLARAKDGATDFGSPTQIDLGRPAGRVDCALLSDGTAVVTWLENSGTDKEGGIFLLLAAAPRTFLRRVQSRKLPPVFNDSENA